MDSELKLEKKERKKEEKKKKHKRPFKLSRELKRMAVPFVFFLVCIIYFEIFMRYITVGSFKDFSWWPFLFVPSEAMLFTIICSWFRRSIPNRILLVVSTFLMTAFYLSQMIYFRIFDSLFSVSMIGMGGDAVANFGWALLSTIKQSIVWIVLFLLPLLAVSAYVLIRKPRHLGVTPIMHGAAALVMAGLWLLCGLALKLGGTGEHTAYEAFTNNYIDTDTAAARIGVFTNSLVEAGSYYFGINSKVDDELIVVDEDDYQGIIDDNTDEEPVITYKPNIIEKIDFKKLEEQAAKEEVKELCRYFDVQNGTNQNEYTGMLKDYNLIYICAEAFSNLAVDKNVTPTLYKLANEGIVLNNFYNSYKNTTTNGEFSFTCGIWPDVSRKADAGSFAGTMAKSANKYMPYGLGTLMSDAGLNCYAFHNYNGYYYNRKKSWANLGYDKCKFRNDGMKFSSAWPSSDLEMMEQSVDDYVNDKRFHAYYMTFSGHGPYSSSNNIANKNIKDVRKLTKDTSYSDAAKCYLACNVELDRAMGYLMNKLKEAGQLDRTMIVLVGDHYPYYLDYTSASTIYGHKPEKNFEMFKSTCIMWVGGLEENIVTDNYCCNVDILPTVLNLFGIKYDSRLLAGRDILSDTTHIAVLYNKSFVTDRVMYNAATGEAVWNEKNYGSATDAEREAYITSIYSIVKSRYASSLKIMDNDFYRFVWEQSGLPMTAPK
ncbi:MAG: sulfatase-like hydrolase/transferase [Clostridia bacterium]|nr:sulfatase-like hydrolase/transferase [Clostridia bacterium]